MKKKIILPIALGLLLVGGVLVGIFWDPIIDWLPIDQSGWKEMKTGGICYLDEDGDPIPGWLEAEGNIYYFDTESYAMQTHWVELDDGRYYLGDDGIRRTGWQEIDGNRYYLGDNGAMVTGWLEQAGGTMYLNEQGNPHSGWLELDEGTYYLDENYFRYSGWLDLEENRYYLDETGAMITGWLELEENRYYLGEDGILCSGWVQLDEGKYYLSEDGVPQTGWLEFEENFYYLDESGVMQTGWLELEEGRYYLCGDGTRYTGWLEVDGNKYYIKEDGTAAKGTLVIDEKTYFFTSSGANVIMVNTWNELPEDYEVELVKLPNGKQASAECYDILMKMVEDCTAAGCSPDIIGAYRTIGDQRVLFNNILAEYREKGYSNAYSKTLKRCAIPGTSEHHLGLAFDIVDKRYPQKYTGENNALVWLSEHCWEYGFIIRYPDNKTNITGIMYEPWHFRYVGVKLAMEMKDNGLCLEEYLDALTGDGTTCGNPDLAKKAA